jgi:23S rRNA pseudouridine955/2504/2580 synthase
VSVGEGGQPSRTEFRLMERRGEFSLVEATLATGRTHQIRVHLAHLGFPILGDDRYGDFELNKVLAKRGLKRMFLHAWALGFDHPLGTGRLELELQLPEELDRFLARVKGNVDAETV